MTDLQTSSSPTVDRSSVILVDHTEVHVEGAGEQAIVMLQGWPDTWRAWQRQIPAFAPHFRCVRFTQPGFDIDQPRRARTLDETLDFLRCVIDAVSPGRPVVLMQHDWGSFFGWQFARRHPERVSRIVAIDIGDAHGREYRSSLRARAIAMTAAYQLWLVLAWRLHPLLPRLADRMTRWMARSMGCRAEPALIGAVMNFPYDIAWTGSHGGYRRLPPLEPHCPVFYAWAERSPLRFHSPGWLERMAALPGNHVQGFDCGHWVMQQRADRFNAAVLQWLPPQSAA